MADDGFGPIPLGPIFQGLDDTVAGAMSNLAGAFGVRPAHAVSAIKAAPALGIPASVGMHDPETTVQLGQQRQAHAVISSTPPLASYLANSGQEVAATVKDHLGQMAALADSVPSYLKGLWDQTPVSNYLHGSDFLPRQSTVQNLTGAIGAEVQREASPALEYGDPIGSVLAKAKVFGGVAGLLGDATRPVTMPLARLLGQEPTHRIGPAIDNAISMYMDTGGTIDRMAQGQAINPIAATAPSRVQSTESWNNILNWALAAMPGGGGELARSAEQIARDNAAIRMVPPTLGPGGKFVTNEHGILTNPTGTPIYFDNPEQAHQYGDTHLWSETGAKTGQEWGLARHGAYAPDEPGGGYAIREKHLNDIPFDAQLNTEPHDPGVAGHRANTDVAMVEDLQKKVAALPFHNDVPSIAANYLSHVAPNTSVYLNPRAMPKDEWGSWSTPEALDWQMDLHAHDPLLFHSWENAKEAGSEMRMPLGDYLAVTAGKPYAQALNKVMRMGEAGVSQAELEGQERGGEPGALLMTPQGAPTEAVDPSRILYHDNTEVHDLEGQATPFTRLMQREFGDRWDDYTQTLGKSLQTFRDHVAGLGGDFASLKQLPVGLSMDTQYYGAYVKNATPTDSAVYLNPAMFKLADPVKATYGLVGTMIHEMAHHVEFEHGAGHEAAMDHIVDALEKAGSLVPFTTDTVDALSHFFDIMQTANREFTNATNVSNGFKTRKHSLSPAGGPGGPEGQGQGADGGSPGLPPNLVSPGPAAGGGPGHLGTAFEGTGGGPEGGESGRLGAKGRRERAGAAEREGKTDASQAVARAFRDQRLRAMVSEPGALGMTKAEFEDYLKKFQTLKEDARDRLVEKALADMAKTREPGFKEAVKQHEAVAEKDLAAHRDMQALHHLWGGTGPLGEPLAAPLKLDNLETENQVGEELYKALPSEMFDNGKGPRGVGPDLAARQLGYGSGQELAQDMANLAGTMQMLGAKTPKALMQKLAHVEGLKRAGEDWGLSKSPAELYEQANEFISTDGVEALMTQELKALAAKVGAPLDLQKVKSEAAERFSHMNSKEATNVKRMERYVAAAGKEAEGALRKGDFRGAFVAKQQQFARRQDLLAALKWTHEYERIVKQARFIASRSVLEDGDPVFTAMLHTLLQEHGFKVPQGNLAYLRQQGDLPNYHTWAPAMFDRGMPVLPYAHIPPEPIHKMSVDETRVFGNRNSNLRHLGRMANKVVSEGKEINLDVAVQQGIANAQGVHKRPPMRGPNPEKDPASVLNWASTYGPENMIDQLDGMDPSGVFNRLLMRPARGAAGRLNDLLVPLLDRINEVLDGVPAKTWSRLNRELPVGHGLMDPVVPTSGLPHEMKLRERDLIGIALTAGTREGKWHLEDGGYGWSRDRYTQLLDDNFTDDHLDLMREVQHMLADLWPQVQEAEFKASGVAPEPLNVEGTELPSGRVILGGYFPLHRNELRSSMLKGQSVETNPQRLAANRLVSAGTNAGHTMRRGENKYVPDLDWLGVLRSHLPSVTRRIAFVQFWADMSKVLDHPDVAKLMAEVHGPQAMEQMRYWVRRQVGNRSVDPRLEALPLAIARRLRMSTYMVMTGLSNTVAVEHMTSVLQSMSVLGLKGGLGAGARIPKQLGMSLLSLVTKHDSDLYNFVNDNSAYMRSTHGSTNYLLTELLNDMEAHAQRAAPPEGVLGHLAYAGRMAMKPINVPGDVLRKWAVGYFTFINYRSMMAPLWYQSYGMARAGQATWGGHTQPPMEHDDAVAHADKMVGLSHGTGLELDMSAFQSSYQNEIIKLFNMFTIFRGTIGHRVRSGIWQMAHGEDAQARADGMWAYMTAGLGTFVTAALLTDQGPQDESLPGWLGWIASKWIDSNMPAIPFGPTMYNFGETMLSGRPIDTEFTPIEGTVAKAGKGLRDVGQIAQGQRPRDQRPWEDIGYLVGMVMMLPLGQPGKMAQVIDDILSGQPVPRPLKALAFGPTHELGPPGPGGRHHGGMNPSMGSVMRRMP